MNVSFKSPLVVEVKNLAGKTYLYQEIKSSIREKDGETVFEKIVQAPIYWSQTAIDIMSQKYFRKNGIPVNGVKPIAEEGIYPEFYRSEALDNPEVPYSEQFTGEYSVHQVLHRLAGCWTYWGIKSGYFNSSKHALEFYSDCYDALYKQIAAPNSPQFFNTGLNWAYGIKTDITNAPLFHNDIKTGEVVKSTEGFVNPQVHACFILGISDNLVNKNGILDLVSREAAVFKYGSGAGSNYSNLRGAGEPLSGGGVSSGLMSFLRIGDSSAGAIKSGGTSRRAAKMLVVDVDHPEIEDYVMWKVKEENKVAALVSGSRLNKQLVGAIVHASTQENFEIAVTKAHENNLPSGLLQRAILAYEQGSNLELDEYDTDWQGEAYSTVSGQNANNSVSISDDYLKAVKTNSDWNLIGRKTKKPVKTIKAKKLWDDITFAAWASADPGLQYVDTMNDWNTCINDELIRATNPCSEYQWFDDTACFTGDTKVWTSKGPIAFKTLAKSKKPILVLTELEDGSVAYREMILPRKTKKNASLIEITVKRRGSRGRKSNFSTIRCTPDHKFFLRNGEVVEAQDLVPEDSIKSAYRYESDNYILINTSSEGMVREHIIMAEYKYGRRPKKSEHVHHKNENKKDNAPDNLIMSSEYKHIAYHSKKWFKTASADKQQARGHKISNSKRGTIAINNGEYTKYLKSDLEIPKGWVRGRSHNHFGEAMNHDLPNNHTVVSVKHLKEKEDVYCGTVPSTGRFFITVGNGDEAVLVKNCNLASLNLVAIYNVANKNIKDFATKLMHYSKLFTTVLDISIQMAQFPSSIVAEKTWKYRTLGLGYGNIGSLLMRMGIPYGKEESVSIVKFITAIIHGSSLLQSAAIANKLEPFPRFEDNKKPFMRVMQKHKDNLSSKDKKFSEVVDILYGNANKIWEQVIQQNKFRNAQVTVIAPMGTIGLIMDCDTTGIEPDFSLIKHKKLAGGGYIKLINQAVPEALNTLGYNQEDIKKICGHISGFNEFPDFDITNSNILKFIVVQDLIDLGVKKEHINDINYQQHYSLSSVLEELETKSNVDLSILKVPSEKYTNTQRYLFGHGCIDDCALVKEEHLPVFDCAVPGKVGGRSLDTDAHLNVMAAAQEFISGGISKTVNLPYNATVKDISDVYFKAHELGIKAVSVYRDGSKLSQPLMSSVAEYITSIVNKYKDKKEPEVDVEVVKQHVVNVINEGTRRKLPNKRTGYTQKVSVSGHTVYLRTGEYQDGKLGEIFLDMHKQGATFRAFMNSFAVAVSIGLQYGVPLEEFVKSFHKTKFEPAGPVVGHDNIKFTSSLIDLIFRDLAFNYLGREDLVEIKPNKNTFNGTQEVFVGKEATLVVNQDMINNTVTLNHSKNADSKVSTEQSPSIYTGDICSNCHSTKMIKAGSCATCQDCGSTTGCG